MNMPTMRDTLRTMKSYRQPIPVRSPIAFLKDTDKDGVVNALDCKPHNPKEQGWIHDKYKQIKENIKEKREASQEQREAEKEMMKEAKQEAVEKRREERKKQYVETEVYKEKLRGAESRKSKMSGGLFGDVGRRIGYGQSKVVGGNIMSSSFIYGSESLTGSKLLIKKSKPITSADLLPKKRKHRRRKHKIKIMRWTLSNIIQKIRDAARDKYDEYKADKDLEKDIEREARTIAFAAKLKERKKQIVKTEILKEKLRGAKARDKVKQGGFVAKLTKMQGKSDKCAHQTPSLNTTLDWAGGMFERGAGFDPLSEPKRKRRL